MCHARGRLLPVQSWLVPVAAAFQGGLPDPSAVACRGCRASRACPSAMLATVAPFTALRALSRQAGSTRKWYLGALCRGVYTRCSPPQHVPGVGLRFRVWAPVGWGLKPPLRRQAGARRRVVRWQRRGHDARVVGLPSNQVAHGVFVPKSWYSKPRRTMAAAFPRCVAAQLLFPLAAVALVIACDWGAWRFVAVPPGMQERASRTGPLRPCTMLSRLGCPGLVPAHFVVRGHTLVGSPSQSVQSRHFPWLVPHDAIFRGRLWPVLTGRKISGASHGHVCSSPIACCVVVARCPGRTSAAPAMVWSVLRGWPLVLYAGACTFGACEVSCSCGVVHYARARIDCLWPAARAQGGACASVPE